MSFDSQKKWTTTYEVLSASKSYNNNLIDYISKTEEFYLSEIESFSDLKKTTPKDLLYLDKFSPKKKNLFNKKIINIIHGFKDSIFQRGY